MKKLLFTLIAALAIIITGCRNDNPPTEPEQPQAPAEEGIYIGNKSYVVRGLSYREVDNSMYEISGSFVEGGFFDIYILSEMIGERIPFEQTDYSWSFLIRNEGDGHININNTEIDFDGMIGWFSIEQGQQPDNFILKWAVNKNGSSLTRGFIDSEFEKWE